MMTESERRDRLAKKAMASWIVGKLHHPVNTPEGRGNVQDVARWSYDLADAMIDERHRRYHKDQERIAVQTQTTGKDA